jgi:hypothetical protein
MQYAADQRHEVAHRLDDRSAAVAKVLNDMLPDAFKIGIEKEFDAVVKALTVFHARLSDKHAEALREMKNRSYFPC